MFVFMFITRKLQTAKSPAAVINVKGLKLRTDITKAVQFVLLSSCSHVRANGQLREVEWG